MNNKSKSILKLFLRRFAVSLFTKVCAIEHSSHHFIDGRVMIPDLTSFDLSSYFGVTQIMMQNFP